jgi:CRISPR-associated exonuclease Cas4
MSIPDIDPMPISALQHWSYCPRQCALIHLEQAFAENVYTQRGRAVHAAVDIPGFETRVGFRVERALPIWCDRLDLVGKADVVEFSGDGTPYPVEYKHGSRHKAAAIALCDDVQLCAQALCLEEMTGRRVDAGALYYARSKRRREVLMTADLRALVERAVAEVHRLLESGAMPAPTEHQARCRACSLIDLCQPEALTRIAHASRLPNALFDPDSE